MSKEEKVGNLIEFEKYKTVLLTRVKDGDSRLMTYEDADGQKYIAMSSMKGMSFAPLFEDGKQLVEYEKKYGGVRRRFAVSPDGAQ